MKKDVKDVDLISFIVVIDGKTVLTTVVSINDAAYKESKRAFSVRVGNSIVEIFSDNIIRIQKSGKEAPLVKRISLNAASIEPTTIFYNRNDLSSAYIKSDSYINSYINGFISAEMAEKTRNKILTEKEGSETVDYLCMHCLNNITVKDYTSGVCPYCHCDDLTYNEVF